MRGKLLLSFVLAVLITILFSASAQAVIYLSSSSISDSPDPVEAGDDVTFRARVISSSNVTAVNVTINGVTYDLSWVEMYGIVYYNYSGTVNSSLIGIGTYTYVIEAINTGLEIDNATGTLTITDTTDPVIAAVSAAPDSVEAGSSITISADVTDNDAVGSLTVTATIAGTPYTLTYDGINYTADIGTTGLPEGTNTFDVDASDASGNAATTVSGSFEIIDNTAPTISSMTEATDPVNYGDTITIFATVTDNVALDTVELTIDSVGTLLSMTATGNPDEFSVLIDTTTNLGGGTLGTYDYTITATDTSSNSATDTGDFTVVDTEDPSINDYSVPTTVCYGDTIGVFANVTDNVAVDYVAINVDGSDYPLSELSENYFTDAGAINSTVLGSLGTFVYSIYANDTSSNAESSSAGFLDVVDCVDPSINTVTESDDPVSYGDTITITAEVTDDILVDTVILTIGTTDYSMSLTGTDTYEATLDTVTDLGALGTYPYTITANDTGDNIDTAAGSFDVVDTIDPTIAAVDASPNPVEIADTVTFSADITDDIAIDSVFLTVNGINYSMTLGTNYSVAVNSSDIGAGNTTYTVTATDSSFNTATATGTLEVVDQQAPTISSLNADPDPVYNDETVTLSATVTDNLAVEDVTVTVDGTEYTMTNTAGDTYEIDVDASTLTLGTVSYIITAIDASENSASESSFFEVFDAIAPTIDTSTLEIDPDTRVNQNETINFSVDVTDINVVENVTLTINGITIDMTNTAGDTYVASFDTTGFALGTYTYTITATDIYSNEATVTGTITVTIISPMTVAIRADKTSGNAELDVSFTSSVTGGVAPLTYRWNFGNNNIDANKNVRHIFRSDGTFTVTLTVFDQYGNEGTDTIEITVGEKEATNNPRNNIRLDSVSIGNDVVEAGDTLDIFVTVENVGEQRLRDISVSAFIPELGVWARTTADDIRSGDSEKQSLALDIPENAEPGIYDVRIVISNDGMKRVKHRDIEII